MEIPRCGAIAMFTDDDRVLFALQNPGARLVFAMDSDLV